MDDDSQEYMAFKIHAVPVPDTEMPGYWCVVCMRYIPEDENGLLVHDKVPHPPLMTFDDDRVMQ